VHIGCKWEKLSRQVSCTFYFWAVSRNSASFMITLCIHTKRGRNLYKRSSSCTHFTFGVIKQSFFVYVSNQTRYTAHTVYIRCQGTNGSGLIGRLARPIRVKFRDKVESLLRGPKNPLFIRRGDISIKASKRLE
jgi:hypothetical protein